MAEPVDAVALGATAFGRAGSNPVPGTTLDLQGKVEQSGPLEHETALGVGASPQALVPKELVKRLPAVRGALPDRQDLGGIQPYSAGTHPKM